LLLAMLRLAVAGVLDAFGVEKDQRSTPALLPKARTPTRPRGQGVRRRRYAPRPSLVVWAIREGRQCARAVDES